MLFKQTYMVIKKQDTNIGLNRVWSAIGIVASHNTNDFISSSKVFRRLISRHSAAQPVHTPDAISYPCIASISHNTTQSPLAHHHPNLEVSRLCNCSFAAKFIHRRSSPALDQ